MERALSIRGTTRGSVLGLAAAAALVLGACGGGGSSSSTYSPPPTSPPPSGGGGSGDVVIDMQGIAFRTSNGTDSITVDVGQTVQWVNRDDVQHTATSDSVPQGAGSFDSGFLSNQGTYSYTVDQAGRYVYHCRVHPNMMAHAVIIAK